MNRKIKGLVLPAILAASILTSTKPASANI